MKRKLILMALVLAGAGVHAATPVGGVIDVPKSSISCKTNWHTPWPCKGWGYGQGCYFNTELSNEPAPGRKPSSSVITVTGGIEGIEKFHASAVDCAEFEGTGDVRFKVQRRSQIQDELGLTTALVLKSARSAWDGQKHETTR